MSVYPKKHKQLVCEVSMTEDYVDLLFGFLTGVASMAVVALIIMITFLQTNGVTWPALSLALASLLTLLLLRGVPIKTIKVGEYLTIKFTVREWPDQDEPPEN